MRAALVGRLRWGWLARLLPAMAAWTGPWTAPWGLSLKTEEGQRCLAIQRVAWIEVLSLLLGVTAWNLAETSLFPWHPTPSNVNLSRTQSSLSDLRKQAMKLSPATTNGAGFWSCLSYARTQI